MSEDKNNYWDEVEQQLNKVSEEREQEKKSLGNNRQRRAHRGSGKKGRRSKEYAEDTMVLAAIAAVEELTKHRDENSPRKVEKPLFAEDIFDESSWETRLEQGSLQEDQPEPEQEVHTEAELQMVSAVNRSEELPGQKAKKEEVPASQRFDTSSMIMLGPEFPLEQFDQLVAEKEAAEKIKVHVPIVLGEPVPIDESLLTPVEEKIKKASVAKSARKRAKAGGSAENPSIPAKSENPVQERKKQQPAQEKSQVAAAVQKVPKKAETSAAPAKERHVLKQEPMLSSSAKKKDEVKPQGMVSAASHESWESSQEQISTQLDQKLDVVTGTAKQALMNACKAFQPQQGKVQPGERCFGPVSHEKLTAQRNEMLGRKYKIFSSRAAVHMAHFWEKESKVGARAAKLVDGVDTSVARMSVKSEYLWLATNRRLKDFEDWAAGHKRLLFRVFTGTLGAAAVVAIAIGQMSAYEYMYNGKVLGVVKNQDDVYQTIDVIGSKMGDAYGTQIEIDKEHDISFNRVIAMDHNVDSTDDILNSLSYMRDVKAKAYGIFVGGKQQVVVQSKEIAQDLLNAIQDSYTPKSTSVKYDNVQFLEKVQIKKVDTKLGEIQNELDAGNYLMTGAVKKTIHEVVQGETFSGIAHAYGIKQSALSEMNPEVNPEKLKIGQEIFLNKDCPVLTVETEETLTYTASMPYEIIYEDTSTLYKGEQTVKAQGADGQQTVVAKVVKQNGMEISNEVVSSQVISQPVNQVVLVGTKAAPKLVGTGTYQYPVRGYRLSSKFGSRWGRTHTGVDLACPSGTKITAADGGTVTFAGYKGSYGYLIIINHGGGRETYYAHCSKLIATKGQKVYQGQYIANVGSTGRSTGPHVHFEVHINGTAKNPLNYL